MGAGQSNPNAMGVSTLADPTLPFGATDAAFNIGTWRTA